MRRLLQITIVMIVGAAAIIGIASVANAAPKCARDPRNPGVCTTPRTPTSPSQTIPDPATAGGSCKTPPDVAMPGRGITGYIAPTPKNVVPVTPDKMTPGDLYATYGFSSFGWSTYDTGCDFNPANVAGKVQSNVVTTIGNIWQSWNIMWAAFLAFLLNLALHTQWLSAFDSFITIAVGNLKDLFTTWAPVSVALTGVLIIWLAFGHKGKPMRKVADIVAKVVLLTSCAATIIAAPLLVAHMFDKALQTVTTSATTTFGATHQTDPANIANGSIVANVYWPQWLSGEVGGSNLPVGSLTVPGINGKQTPVQFALFDATHYTLAEAKIINTGGPPADRLRNDKGAEYRIAAEKVAQNDHNAYNVLKGYDDTQRWSAAALTTMGGIFTMPFILVACGWMIVAFIAVRVVVMLAPLILAVAIFPPMFHFARSAADKVAGYAVKGALAFVFGMFDIWMVGRILSPQVHFPGGPTGDGGLMRLFVCFILQLVMFKLMFSFGKRNKGPSKTKTIIQEAAVGAAAGGAAGAGAAAAGATLRHVPQPESQQPRGELWSPQHAAISAHTPAVTSRPDGDSNMPPNYLPSLPSHDPNALDATEGPVRQEKFRPGMTTPPQRIIEYVQDEDGHYVPADPNWDPADDLDDAPVYRTSTDAALGGAK